MLRSTRLCAWLAAGLVLLCASCTGGNPPDDPTGPPSAPSTSASPAETGAGPSPSSDEQALLDKVRAEGQLTVLVTLHALDATAELLTQKPPFPATFLDEIDHPTRYQLGQLAAALHDYARQCHQAAYQRATAS